MKYFLKDKDINFFIELIKSYFNKVNQMIFKVSNKAAELGNQNTPHLIKKLHKYLSWYNDIEGTQIPLTPFKYVRIKW